MKFSINYYDRIKTVGSQVNRFFSVKFEFLKLKCENVLQCRMWGCDYFFPEKC